MPNCYCGKDVAHSAEVCPRCGSIDRSPRPLRELLQGGLLLLLACAVFIAATISAIYFAEIVGDLLGMNE